MTDESFETWATAAAEAEGLKKEPSPVDLAFADYMRLDRDGFAKDLRMCALLARNWSTGVSVQPVEIDVSVPVSVQDLLASDPELLELYETAIVLMARRLAALGVCGMVIEPAHQVLQSSMLAAVPGEHHAAQTSFLKINGFPVVQGRTEGEPGTEVPAGDGGLDGGDRS